MGCIVSGEGAEQLQRVVHCAANTLGNVLVDKLPLTRLLEPLLGLRNHASRVGQRSGVVWHRAALRRTGLELLASDPRQLGDHARVEEGARFQRAGNTVVDKYLRDGDRPAMR